MQTSTTPTIAERETVETLGVVSGEAIIGAHIFRDFFAGITNIIGGRAGGYEKALRQARDIAIADETLGADNGMMMVTASGTAVRLR
jgi:uncharacterized protein YbjQ (UPF0145 family)